MMLRKGLGLLLLFTLCGAGALLADGPEKAYTPAELAKMAPAERHAAAQAMKDNEPPATRFEGTLKRVDTGRASRASAGTLIYDDGVFSTIGTIPTVDVMFGNQFNSVSGNPIPPPITVTAIAMWPALVNGSTTAPGSAWQSVFGPVNGAGTAATQSALFSSQTGFTPSTWNTNTVGAIVIPTTAGASFLAGMWNGAGAPGAAIPCATDCLGFSTGTAAGQGFHGMRLQDVNGASFATIQSLNGMVRASGNVVPVELMSFSVD